MSSTFLKLVLLVPQVAPVGVVQSPESVASHEEHQSAPLLHLQQRRVHSMTPIFPIRNTTFKSIPNCPLDLSISPGTAVSIVSTFAIFLVQAQNEKLRNDFHKFGPCLRKYNFFSACRARPSQKPVHNWRTFSRCNFFPRISTQAQGRGQINHYAQCTELFSNANRFSWHFSNFKWEHVYLLLPKYFLCLALEVDTNIWSWVSWEIRESKRFSDNTFRNWTGLAELVLFYGVKLGEPTMIDLFQSFPMAS